MMMIFAADVADYVRANYSESDFVVVVAADVEEHYVADW